MSETVVEKIKNYYNSQDADEFYFQIWGGEDIHIGIYNNNKDSIYEASRRSVSLMADQLGNVDKNTKILDIGSGYGGAARFLAKKFQYQITCLNLSEKENQRNIEKNREQGLDQLIEVKTGSFEDLPFENNFFDVVWSEDAILHSANKEKVFSEVYRVLKDGGQFIFTDPMQSENADPAQLKPVYDRIHLDEMGSFGRYEKSLAGLGMEKIQIMDLSKHLPVHYGRIKELLFEKKSEIENSISPEYIEKMIDGLQHWVDAGNAGNLSWGILHFRK